MEMSLAAIFTGKHVYCEKPLAPIATDAAEMTDAAEAKGVKTQVGFNYLCNPIFGLARDMIQSGELGEIRSYRGQHAEDFMVDAGVPHSFRTDPIGGGALVDLGSHALATAEFLCGPIKRVIADAVTHVGNRPNKDGPMPVQVDDATRALVRFENGASGSIEANWISTGQKMSHDFEIYGSKGGLTFSGERLNELRYYAASDPAGRHGFRTIYAGPEHPPYGKLSPATGHQIGFNDLKAIEAAHFIETIAGQHDEPFNFRAGLRIQTLVEAVQRSAKEERWLDV